MNRFPNYRLATNYAYLAILDLNICSLPIDIAYMTKRFENVRLKSFGEFCSQRNVDREYFIRNLATSDQGFTLKMIKGNESFSIILYNEDKSSDIIRFTIAHELGHFILGHTIETPNTEKEANCFARNVLCPAPIIKELCINGFDEYCDIFDVSPIMAQVSCKYKEIDLYNIDKGHYDQMYNSFSLSTLTKEAQLNNYNARLENARTAFASSF